MDKITVPKEKTNETSPVSLRYLPAGALISPEKSLKCNGNYSSMEYKGDSQEMELPKVSREMIFDRDAFVLRPRTEPQKATKMTPITQQIYSLLGPGMSVLDAMNEYFTNHMDKYLAYHDEQFYKRPRRTADGHEEIDSFVQWTEERLPKVSKTQTNCNNNLTKKRFAKYTKKDPSQLVSTDSPSTSSLSEQNEENYSELDTQSGTSSNESTRNNDKVELSSFEIKRRFYKMK